MSVMPRSARAAITSGWARIASSTSWYSSTVKCGVTPGTWVHDTTESSVRSTTPSKVWLSARFHSTANAVRRIGSPGRQAFTSAFGGSSSSIDANRHDSSRDWSRRRAAAVCRNSASSSGSSGCCAISVSCLRDDTPTSAVPHYATALRSPDRSETGRIEPPVSSLVSCSSGALDARGGDDEVGEEAGADADQQPPAHHRARPSEPHPDELDDDVEDGARGQGQEGDAHGFAREELPDQGADEGGSATDEAEDDQEGPGRSLGIAGEWCGDAEPLGGVVQADTDSYQEGQLLGGGPRGDSGPVADELVLGHRAGADRVARRLCPTSQPGFVVDETHQPE